MKLYSLEHMGCQSVIIFKIGSVIKCTFFTFLFLMSCKEIDPKIFSINALTSAIMILIHILKKNIVDIMIFSQYERLHISATYLNCKVKKLTS